MRERQERFMLDFFKDLKDIERNAMNIFTFTEYNTLKL